MEGMVSDCRSAAGVHLPGRRISTPYLQAACARAVEKRRCGFPPGGFRGSSSSWHKASRMASMRTGIFSPSGARSAGHEAIADASEAQEARIALFGQRQGRMYHHVLGVLEDGAGVKGALESRRRCRLWRSSAVWFPPFKDVWGGSPNSGPPQYAFARAALDSIWCTLACAAPLMAIRRGFRFYRLDQDADPEHQGKVRCDREGQ